MYIPYHSLIWYSMQHEALETDYATLNHIQVLAFPSEIKVEYIDQ